MNFLLDENVPLSIKKTIKELGHKVLTLHEENKLGIRNGDVAELALLKNAIVITLDSDFLILKKQIQERIKIIYIKIHPRDPKTINNLIRDHLEECLIKLNQPGKVILSVKNIKFEHL